MAESILFIYGTLRRGQPANYLLRGARFLGEAVTVPRYRLHDIGPYPGLVETGEDGTAIRGELWAVPAELLGRLDEYEGAPELYSRGLVTLEGDPGRAEGYLFRGPVPASARAIGRWRRRGAN